MGQTLIHVGVLIECIALIHCVVRSSRVLQHLTLRHRPLLTHLDTDMVELLHAHKLPQVLLGLLLAVLEAVVVFHPELIEFNPVRSYSLL